VVVAGALLVKAFAGIDTRATWRALCEAGRWAPLALVPFVFAMSLDAAGIGILLGTLGRKVKLVDILPIRIASEALHLTAPAGFVVADSATAALLDARCGVPVAEGAVIAIARKWLVMRAHAVYIALGAIGGAAVLAAVSRRALGGPWLPWAVGASGLAPLALGAGFRGKPALARLQNALARLPWRALQDRIARWRSGAVRTDATLAQVGASPRATWTACASFFGCWLCESIETAIIVRLVGGPLDLTFAMACEVGISMLRSIGNVAPAGLGVQDAGYAVLFEAMGLPAHTTAAFVLLKRAKELTSIAVGYGLLAALRRPATALEPAAPGAAARPGARGVIAASAGFVRRVARSAPVRALVGDARGATPRQPAG
jgi:hypothetical protein